MATADGTGRWLSRGETAAELQERGGRYWVRTSTPGPHHLPRLTCGMDEFPPLPITGAENAIGNSVPKRNLIAAVQVPLQQGLLKITPGLPLGEVSERELTGFRMKLTASGRDSYDIARKAGASHGDLVIALALAARREKHSVPPPVKDA